MRYNLPALNCYSQTNYTPTADSFIEPAVVIFGFLGLSLVRQSLFVFGFYWISMRRALETVCCFFGRVSFSTPSAYSAFMPLSSMPLTSKER